MSLFNYNEYLFFSLDNPIIQNFISGNIDLNYKTNLNLGGSKTKKINESEESDELDNLTNINWNIGIFDPDGINPNPFNNEPYSDTYKNLAKFWSNLPAYSMGKKIVQSILTNDVILIKSGTGSGKSVTIPKFCLHANNYSGQIIMTLPKKIITKKAAEFSAKTLDIKLGDYVGYQFRGDNKKSKKTVLLYATDGSIIAMAKNDPMLKSVDIIIIDEAHERKIQIDLLIYLIRNAIQMRLNSNLNISPLKLIIMSATINEEIFKSYFSNFKFDSMELAGTPNHPIKSIYLESSLSIKSNQYIQEGKKIIGQIIEKINSNYNKSNSQDNYDDQDEWIEGDILFFVCTISECDQLANELGKLFPDCFTMGLYSGLEPKMEQYISSPDKYKELDKNYKRRLFISTNVAESSLTIDGIVYVIDSGLELLVKFDPESNTNIMTKNFITQAQMTQRKGRAGRTKPGVCYHLYTPREQDFAIKYPEPEIKRVDLKNTCLTLLKMCVDFSQSIESDKSNKSNGTNKSKETCNISTVKKMFSNFIEPPDEKFISNGFDFAIKSNIIDKSNQLSLLGNLIVESRLDVMDGLALHYAWNISDVIFKYTFKLICICSLIKSGPLDLFNPNIDFDSNLNSNSKSNSKSKSKSNSNKTKTNDDLKKKALKLIDSIKKNCLNSEHLFIHYLYKHIKANCDKKSKKSTKLFNMELFESVENLYKRNVNKLFSLYSKFNIKIDNVNQKDFDSNIIYSFNYGYKLNMAKFSKSKSNFYYNGTQADLKKCLFADKLIRYPNIIFSSNLNWENKLNIIICSPYLLD